MGKKKAFIDKKKAITYSLVYRDPSEDPDGEDGGQRILAPVGGARGPQPPSEDYNGYYEDEGSIYNSEYSLSMSRSAAAHHDASYILSEERRRELLSLGFPDDGYDYLKHMRDLGRGKVPPAAAGRGGVATIPEDQELDGFDEGDIEAEEGDEWRDGSDSEEDFTIYDEPEAGANAGGGGGPVEEAGYRKKLDAAALAAVAAAGAAAEGAGPSTSPSGGGGRATAAAAGPGPGSSRAAAAAAAVSTAARSVGSRRVARSVATTARTHGSGLGPSVYVPAARLMPPKPDVKVVDARRLVVRPKGHDEAAAAAALAEVTAHARHTELHGRRGRLYQDLDDLEKSMVAMENGNDPNRAEQVEGDEWADWLDEFVAGGGGDDGGAGGVATAAVGEGEEDEGDAGNDSEEPGEEDEDDDEWLLRHRHKQHQQQHQPQQQLEEGKSREGRSEGAAAAACDGGCRGGRGDALSLASSQWRRPERRDRKEGFEVLDAQFERLAVEYDDADIGALEDGRYDDDDDGDDNNDDDEEYVDFEDGDGGAAARKRSSSRAAPQAAAGNCELSDFADVLDEFLVEHRAAEALEAEGLRPIQASDDVAYAASRPDPEALAATKTRIKRQIEAQMAAGMEADDDEPLRTIVVQDAERWDCESILSLTSNLENHPGKIVEPQRRTGGKGGGLIRLSAKTGMPVLPGGMAGGGRESKGAAPAIPEEEEGASGGEVSGSEDEEGTRGGSMLDQAMLTRHKGETAEERKARKAAVKEARRNQRTAKKEMKTMFRQQATRAQKQTAGRSLAAGSTYVIP